MRARRARPRDERAIARRRHDPCRRSGVNRLSSSAHAAWQIDWRAGFRSGDPRGDRHRGRSAIRIGAGARAHTTTQSHDTRTWLPALDRTWLPALAGWVPSESAAYPPEGGRHVRLILAGGRHVRTLLRRILRPRARSRTSHRLLTNR